MAIVLIDKRIVRLFAGAVPIMRARLGSAIVFDRASAPGALGGTKSGAPAAGPETYSSG